MAGRVLLVHGNTEWYGSDRAFLLLARGLRERGVDISVGLPGPCALSDAFVQSGFRPLFLGVAPFRPRVFGRLQLIRYLFVELPRAALLFRRTARRFDLVHLNTSNLLGGIIGGALARRPVVLHVRESYEGYERQWRLYCRLIRPCVTRVVTTSAAIEREAAVAGLGDRAVTIHDGMEFDTKALVAGEGPVVSVGRINDWKGHDVLIEAIARLRERGHVVPLQIAGDAFPGQEHRVDELEVLAGRLDVADRVRLLGWVDDVDALLERSGMFVLPSVRPEPFGLALVDAMARGLACIATDAGGPQEIIRHEKTGLLVPPRDVEALADAIERLWIDPALRRRLGEAGANDVRARFSIESNADRVAGLYDQLLDQRQ